MSFVLHMSIIHEPVALINESKKRPIYSEFNVAKRMKQAHLEKVYKIEKVISQLIAGVGKAFAWLSLATLLLSCCIVLFRYLFDFGSIALQELVIYLHAATFLFCMAYTLQQDRHIRVDIFYRNVSPEIKAIINIAGTLCMLWPLLILISWQSYGYIAIAWQIKEGSADAGGLPYVYILKSMIFIMVFLLLLQSVADLINNLKIFFKRPRQ